MASGDAPICLTLSAIQEPLPKRLRRLADCAEEQGVASVDVYGNSPALQAFEAEVSALLGKPRGLWFCTGTLAQRAALHAHREQQWEARKEDASGSPRVLLHPTSHLIHHECLRNGPEQAKRTAVEAAARLPAFEFHRVIALSDFDAASLEALGPLDTVVLELPQRCNGGRTVDWEDLEKISRRVRQEAGGRLHMDGERLWDVQPFYCSSTSGGKTLADTAALFDSVYVSFYKGLGGMTGAMLVGQDDFIQRAKDWRLKLGGNVFAAAPHWLDAREQLKRHVSAMPSASMHCPSFQARLDKLREVVARLTAETDTGKFLRFEPPVPQSCMVHCYIRTGVSMAELDAAHEEAAAATGVRLWNGLRGTGYGPDGGESGGWYFEWSMGPDNCQIDTDRMLEGWKALGASMQVARSASAGDLSGVKHPPGSVRGSL